MTVRVYDGNTATVLNSWVGVKQAAIMSDGSLQLITPVIGMDGEQAISISPAPNKITVERAYNE